MSESAYGLIVEGFYDAEVFPEFVHKILSVSVEVIPRIAGDKAQLMRKFSGFLRGLEHDWRGGPVDKALVIRDCNGGEQAVLEQKMAARVHGCQFTFPHTVQFFAVRREMETWLLADVEALNAVAVERGGRSLSDVTGQLEEIHDPKGLLKQRLSKAGLPYTAEVCRQIACLTRLEQLRYRCPSFCAFEVKVIDC